MPLSLGVQQCGIDCGFDPSWRQWHPTPVLLPGKSHGRRSLVGCSPWGHGGSDTTERLHFDFSLSCIGEGNGNPLQCSCLKNPRDRGAWWAAVYEVAQSQTWLTWLSSSSSIPLYISTSSLFVNEHLDCFHFLAVVNGAAVNIMVHMFDWIIISSEYMSRSDIAGSCGNSIIVFWESLYFYPQWLHQFTFLPAV